MSQSTGWVPSAGTTVAGRYEVKSELGKGGMARVWLARDTRTGDEVALKHIYFSGTNYDRHPGTVERMFQNEVDVLRQVRDVGGHESIIDLHDAVTEQGTQLAVVELVEGKELDDEDLSLSESEARKVTMELASAMGFLHRNKIIYRDLKPDNAMVQQDGSPVLIDFNTAKPYDSDAEAALKCPDCSADVKMIDAVCPDCGTDLEGGADTEVGIDQIPYYPPESYEGKKQFRQGPWSDVYSVGRIFMRLLLPENMALPGKDGRGPQAFNVDCQDYNNEIIKRATVTDPSDRYNNARVLEKVLEQRDPEPPTEAVLTHQQSGEQYQISPGDTIGRVGADGPEATITLKGPGGNHISAVQLQFDIDQNDNWILRDKSLNGTYVQHGNGWERVLCQTGRRRLRNDGRDPTDTDGNVPPEELPLQEGALIALVDPSYGVSFIFEEVL